MSNRFATSVIALLFVIAILSQLQSERSHSQFHERIRDETLNGRYESLEESQRRNLQRIEYYVQHPELLVDCDECNFELAWAYYLERSSEKRPLRKARCVEVMSKAIELDPENPIYYDTLASFQWDMKETKESTETCELGLQRVPLDYALHARLYWAYLELEQRNKADAMLDQMVERFPQKAEPLHWRAQNWKERGRRDLALIDYSSAVENSDSKEDRWYSLICRGLFYLENEDFELAIADFESSSAIAPNPQRLQTSLAYLKDAKNQGD